MNLIRLAELLSIKYRLSSFATPAKDIVDDIYEQLKMVYKRYCTLESDISPIGFLAEHKEPFSVEIKQRMEEIVANIGKMNLEQLFTRINNLGNMISEMKKDPEKAYRNSIHDSIMITRKSDKDKRELLKNKFEGAIRVISSILYKQSIILKKIILSKETILSDKNLPIQRKELPGYKFDRSNPINYKLEEFGLTKEVLPKILEDKELKGRVTTLINAIERGHYPKDAPILMEEAKDIMARFNLKNNNVEALEGEIFAPESVRPAVKVNDDSDWLEDFKKRKIKLQKEQDLAAKYPTYIPNVPTRDLNVKVNVGDEKKLLDKYNNLSFEQFMRLGNK